MVWVETVLNGIFLGGLYGILGLGLALVFGVMKVINVAHGDFIVLSAFIGVFLSAAVPGVSPLLIILPVVAIAAGLGWAFQSVLMNRVIDSDDMLVPMLLTFGVSFVMRNIMLETFGATPVTLEAGALSRASFQVAGLHLGVLPVLTLAISVVLFGGLNWLITRTEIGRVIRATSDNTAIARLMGVRPGRIYALVMALSLALAAVAGLLLAMRTSFTPSSGIDRILIAFEVVVLGGLGSFWGALLAGIALGVTQLVGFRFDANSGLLYAHLLFLAFLIARPNGLFGSK
ncbi:branched-chain amino acid ABC transporter permease [Pseudooceanicola sp. CBS1P-1]|uniref:Branched-chain amino acid ABC transporter permease n=1 Tax=Pseudooceanicola albus TaxID=2692189 RepID=A0A6L7GCF8_9RHOB|nr:MULTISPECIES: branched-chain amino acid ABC transporter permease [Pseudooceanicola]MBT9386772.1 branched-chain amino acid ABC transporter permease [Pseudooceanicola endophyticus]MXN20966.1 branched-chain amino acid ABC transporter permease [Pseudooceanicola albus]